MDLRQMLISVILSAAALCTALEDGLTDENIEASLTIHNPHKRSTSVLLPLEDDVLYPEDDLPLEGLPLEDPEKRGGLLRYGRGSLLRFGKRGALFRFGKRGSLFRFGKRGSLFRFGKRGSIFRFGKRGNLFRFGRSDQSPLELEDIDVKRGALFRFGKRSDLPSQDFQDLDKREVDGFHWGQSDD